MEHIVKKSISLFFVLNLFACATSYRTKYLPLNSQGGYEDHKINESVRVARFTGNAYTNVKDASKLSVFRAIEVCRESGNRIARIFGQNNLSKSKDYQRSSSYTYSSPTHFTGNATTTSNYNYLGGGMMNSSSNTNFNGTFQGGQTYGGGSSWVETLTFPTYDTYFACHDQAWAVGIVPKDLTVEDLKPLVKDLMAAIQIESLSGDSPNFSVLQVGDIIYKVNKKRITNGVDFILALNDAPNKQQISLQLFRDGKQKTVNVIAVDLTQEFTTDNQEVVSMACTVPEIKARSICPQPSKNESGKNCTVSFLSNGETIRRCE